MAALLAIQRQRLEVRLSSYSRSITVCNTQLQNKNFSGSSARPKQWDRVLYDAERLPYWAQDYEYSTSKVDWVNEKQPNNKFTSLCNMYEESNAQSPYHQGWLHFAIFTNNLSDKWIS